MRQARDASYASHVEVTIRGRHNPVGLGIGAAAWYKIIAGGERGAAVRALANQPMPGSGAPLFGVAKSDDVQVASAIRAASDRPRDLPTLKLERVDLRPGRATIGAPPYYPCRDSIEFA